MLSEVYTQEDLDMKDDAASGRLQLQCIALPPSILEIKTPSPTRNPPEWLAMGDQDLKSKQVHVTESEVDRPAVNRGSTSGTEVYMPV